jgi:hypothetical protein
VKQSSLRWRFRHMPAKSHFGKSLRTGRAKAGKLPRFTGTPRQRCFLLRSQREHRIDRGSSASQAPEKDKDHQTGEIARYRLHVAAFRWLAGFLGRYRGIMRVPCPQPRGRQHTASTRFRLVSRTHGERARGPLGTYNCAGDLSKATPPPLLCLRPVVAARSCLCRQDQD